jgi:hypothetical protein
VILPFLRRTSYSQRVEISKSTDLANGRDKFLKEDSDDAVLRNCPPTENTNCDRSNCAGGRTCGKLGQAAGVCGRLVNPAKAKPHSADTASQHAPAPLSGAHRCVWYYPGEVPSHLPCTSHGIHKWRPGPIVSADGPQTMAAHIAIRATGGSSIMAQRPENQFVTLRRHSLQPSKFVK